MAKCKHCGADYVEGTRFCPVCCAPLDDSENKTEEERNVVKAMPKVEKKKSFAWIFLIFIIAALGLAVVAFSSVLGGKISFGGTTTNYKKGEVATFESGTIIYDGCNVFKSKNESYQPPDGYEFLQVNFTVRNTTTSSYEVGNEFVIKATINGKAKLPSQNALTASKGESIERNIKAQGSMSGCVCFEMPIGWSELEISVKNGKDTGIFTIKNPTKGNKK